MRFLHQTVSFLSYCCFFLERKRNSFPLLIGATVTKTDVKHKAKRTDMIKEKRKSPFFTNSLTIFPTFIAQIRRTPHVNTYIHIYFSLTYVKLFSTASKERSKSENLKNIFDSAEQQRFGVILFFYRNLMNRQK